jgi:hypothetical protein
MRAAALDAVAIAAIRGQEKLQSVAKVWHPSMPLRDSNAEPILPVGFRTRYLPSSEDSESGRAAVRDSRKKHAAKTVDA